MAKYKVYQSNSTDPRVNLSLEEYFMETVEDEECILLFWQSENAIVIGVNQNPYQECNLTSLIRDDVVMVRRLSGGGAVYHDLGNLNFAFIAKCKHFNIKSNFNIILTALKQLGIEGQFNGRNDLTTTGRKFSGNAFIHEADRHLHHGTLLINADITKVSDYLTVSHKKLDNKGFDSIRSRVINLCEINPKITPVKIIEAVVDVLKAEETTLNIENLCPDENALKTYISKYMSHEWNFGGCADFQVQVEEKFDWGLVSLEMTVSSGGIKHIKIRTDALAYDIFNKLNFELTHTLLTEKSVYELIDKNCLDRVIKNDLKALFSEHIFK